MILWSCLICDLQISRWCHVHILQISRVMHGLSGFRLYGGFGEWHGTLTSYIKLWVALAPGMLRKFSPPSRISDPDMHHGTYVTHVPWCMPGSLTGGFIWSQWRRKRSRHSRCMHNPQFYVSGKRPMMKDSAVCLVKNRDLVNQCVAGHKID